jgi:DNA-directed RNA polymerase sigma subunit (sigma70/sigma32)
LATEDILTTEELYRSEVRRLPRLSVEEEQEIVRRAREGDENARTALVKSCLNYVGFIAACYRRFVRHDEYLDLVGVGNVAVVEHLDRALLMNNPSGYLRSIVKYTVLHYCLTHASLITRPDRSAPIYTVSLDAPRDDGQPLAQRLAAQEGSSEEERPDYAFLYQALEQLPKHYREVLSRHYGLYGRTPESLYELSRRMSANVKGSIAYLTKYRALRRLRTQLTKGGTDHPEALNR